MVSVLFIITMHNYATTPSDRPVVKGVYKFTRNPQQLLVALMLIGIASITESVFIVISCILQLLLMYPTFISQERFCIDKYGQEYEEYMKRTPRHFWKI
ncbi:MAG: hypothetical protein K6T91_07485 [Firmicutes bacterium]|nr:hypothetical protein [Bacillota bacterium]